MNFYTIVVYSYICLASLFIYFLLRDSRIKGLFFYQHRKAAYTATVILILGIFIALYAHFVEPFILVTKNVDIASVKIKQPLKIAFITDIQAGNHKKSEWVEKINEKISKQNPDLVIFGGDLIDNEGNIENESVYLEPLGDIAKKYPSFYVLGNHEYGLGMPDRSLDRLGTGNRTAELTEKMKELNISLLKNTLRCLNIKNQNVCLFGMDDIYAGERNYAQLQNLPEQDFLILISHNPDGILSYPNIFNKPDLVLSGHTHGGQVALPFLGPLGEADLILPNDFYRGLNYWNEIPVFTSVGAGESGGQIRFLAVPEIIIINLNY